MGVNDVTEVVLGRAVRFLLNITVTVMLGLLGYLGTSINSHLSKQDEELQKHGEALATLTAQITNLINGQSGIWTEIHNFSDVIANQANEEVRLKQRLDDTQQIRR